jgi:hypothetical protein
LAACVLACGPVDTLAAFDVTLVVSSDCVVVGAGSADCIGEDATVGLLRTGRWTIDHRNGYNALFFVLTDEEGRAITGVHFPNSGDPATNKCVGQGGECYFATTSVTTTDADGCDETRETVVDGFVTGDVINALEVYTRLNGDACEEAIQEQVLTDVTGTRSDDAVLARETP